MRVITLPCIMFQRGQVPVLVLELGWSDSGGYGPIPIGVDCACLADLGHVIEPRVVKAKDLLTPEEAALRYSGLAEDALRRSDSERSTAARHARAANQVRRYALLNGVDW